jgi:hypothetical protein
MKSASLPQQISSTRTQRFLQSAIRHPQSAILLVFLVLLAISWQRWTSVIADSGRELDLPLRLLQGELLYRDVHYLYPPLAPYFNALLYRLFGAHLSVLQASGVLCSLLLAWFCYRIARRLLTPSESSLAVCYVIVLCIFKPAGNLISPYTYAALYALLCALGALLCTLRYAENRRARELCLAGLLIGLAAITKQEFALAGATTVLISVCFLHRGQWRQGWRALCYAIIPALAVAVPVSALLLHQIGWQTLVEDCHLFYTHLPAPLVFYNAQRSGLAQPFASLLQMLGGAGVGLAAVSLIVWLSLWRQAAAPAGRQLRRNALFVLLAAVASVCLLVAVSHGQWDGSPLRALPLLLLAIVVYESRQNSSASRFIIAVYSLAMLARVALRVPSGGAFGGFFLPTSLILICHLLVHALPNALERWAQQAMPAHRARVIGQVLLGLLLVVSAFVFGIRYRRNYSFPVETPRGRLFTTQASGPAYRDALAFLQTQTQPGEAVAVFPEGSDLTFLTGRRMPLRHQIFIPGLMSPADEERAIEQLRALPIRYVLIVNRPMREFGAEAFGRDFYTRLGAAIEEQYRLIKVCGAVAGPNAAIGDPQFFIKILARKD